MSSLTKTIPLSKIKVNSRFKRTPPRQEKLDKVRDFYKAHGELDKPIYLNDEGYLVDGYTRYLIAQEMNQIMVDVVVLSDDTLPFTHEDIFKEMYKEELAAGKKEYIVGVFPNVFSDTDRRKYVWVNKKCLLINIGDTVRVKCRRQDGKIFTANVIVVEKFWSAEELNHRSVTKVIQKAS